MLSNNFYKSIAERKRRIKKEKETALSGCI